MPVALKKVHDQNGGSLLFFGHSCRKGHFFYGMAVGERLLKCACFQVIMAFGVFLKGDTF